MDFSLPLSVHGGEKRKSKESKLVEQRGKEAMEGALSMGTHTHTKQQKITRDVLPFARSCRLEALDKAIRENTIVYLETGSGKPLIAIMLLRRYAHHLRKPSPFTAVFVVPQVVLVSQQAETVKKHTDLKVGVYWGDMGVHFWDGGTWKQEMEKYEVLIMTPVILLNCLRHSFLELNMIKVLIMDECHHSRSRHPYACIMTEFYHPQLQYGSFALPESLVSLHLQLSRKSGAHGVWLALKVHAFLLQKFSDSPASLRSKKERMCKRTHSRSGLSILPLLHLGCLTDMRCIIFVERIVTAIVFQDLFNTLLPNYNIWKTKFFAGNNFGLKNWSRRKQNEIVEEFRMGLLLDLIHLPRSFIQSRGCVRMKNSDYILMFKSQQLFKTYQSDHEGLLSLKREKIISNAALCKFGCSSGLPGFIRNEPFDPRTWPIPGDKSGSFKIEELISKGKKIYISGQRKSYASPM
ncbi:hypothetical protein ACSQ67_016522 [Phaseolus vulgaris]